MDSNASIFLFYYFWELWRHARERARLEAELAAEDSGVFVRAHVQPDAANCADRRSAIIRIV